MAPMSVVTESNYGKDKLHIITDDVPHCWDTARLQCRPTCQVITISRSSVRLNTASSIAKRCIASRVDAWRPPLESTKWRTKRQKVIPEGTQPPYRVRRQRTFQPIYRCGCCWVETISILGERSSAVVLGRWSEGRGFDSGGDSRILMDGKRYRLVHRASARWRATGGRNLRSPPLRRLS